MTNEIYVSICGAVEALNRPTLDTVMQICASFGVTYYLWATELDNRMDSRCPHWGSK